MEMDVKVTGTKTLTPEELPKALGFPEGTTVKFHMDACNTGIGTIQFNWAMDGVMDVDKLNRLASPPLITEGIIRVDNLEPNSGDNELKRWDYEI